MTEGISKFMLLQVIDGFFPIGGYSHSYGLETYIQKGIVKDEDSAGEFIRKRLQYNFYYNDFFAVRLAWEYSEEENLGALEEMVCSASRLESSGRIVWNIFCTRRLPLW